MLGNTNAKIGGSSSGLQLGDRLLNIASFVTYFTPIGIYDKDSLKSLIISQKNDTNLTNLNVDKSLWLTQIETVLSIIINKGTQNVFNFTYNGSTWDLTGTTTINGISTSDLNTVYGITYIGIPKQNDIINVIERYYNKFACYVLDSNYRGIYAWSTGNLIPNYSSTPQPCNESATYFNNIIWNTVSPLTNSPMFNFVKSFGDIVLPNGLKVNVLIPNADELLAISSNRNFLDGLDAAQVSGKMLNDYIAGGQSTPICQQPNDNNFWYWRNASYWENARKIYDVGVVTVLEVPTM